MRGWSCALFVTRRAAGQSRFGRLGQIGPQSLPLVQPAARLATGVNWPAWLVAVELRGNTPAKLLDE